MSFQPLNFSTQAIDALLADAQAYQHTAPQSYKNVHHIVELLRQAVKFYLPDNGRLFDSGLKALPVMFRLPYPIIAAEFRVTKEGSKNLQPINDDALFSTSKRIALAIEIHRDTVDQYRWLFPVSQDECIGDDGVIAIIPIYYIDSQDSWNFAPVGGFVAASHVSVSQDIRARTEHVFGGNLPKGTSPLPIVMYPLPLMPEVFQKIKRESGIDRLAATAMQDCSDELFATLELIEILSCKNVVTQTVDAPAKLNAKRIRTQKTPFFEYKILVIDQEKASSEPAANPRSSHASPRVHLRRGHIRRLPGGNIWINSMVVGSKQAGTILKDYGVR